jgi:hypothetical protein
MVREKTPPCNNGCGQRIWFDWNAQAGDPGRSERGKMRPLQVSEDGALLNQIHDCPNSTYNKDKGISDSGNRNTTSSTTTTVSTAALAIGIEAIGANTNVIAAGLSKLQTEVDELSRMVYRTNEELLKRLDKILMHLMGNPLDDDGDSQRENQEPE